MGLLTFYLQEHNKNRIAKLLNSRARIVRLLLKSVRTATVFLPFSRRYGGRKKLGIRLRNAAFKNTAHEIEGLARKNPGQTTFHTKSDEKIRVFRQVHSK